MISRLVARINLVMKYKVEFIFAWTHTGIKYVQPLHNDYMKDGDGFKNCHSRYHHTTS